ncbi:hypothetical protein BC351_37260 [Paenibacillus ferrarius]|uniref:Sugar ABC transporter substrate-binding protein n=1 Tax=Paenibacillus ferrarius TaxID=1469647 RepID=A0A1V4HBA3_9BACL|nr:extracellular solute-binding protein [Paenibacillus ferrarius]OPH49327.1 hypothetical protein BC351_37260 [Paenibacillus ferrarius]
MKKTVSWMALSVLLVSVTLTGCSTGSSNQASPTSSSTAASTESGAKKSQKVTIKIAGFNKEEGRKTYLEMLKEKFPNYDIQYQFIDNKQYSNVVTTYLASGEGPDILEGGDAKWAAAGYLEDLTSQPFVSKYYETGLKPFTVGGKVYSIPLQSWFEGIWYNKDLFVKAGIQPPKTFDDWMKAHDALRAAGIKPQAMGAKSWEPMMKQSIGVALNDFYSKPENKNFDEEFGKGSKKLFDNWKDAFTKWDQTVQKKNLTPDMLGIDYDQAQDEFATGKAAMWESGPWAYDGLMKKNPNLNLGMFPIPGSAQGSGWLIGGPGSAWSVNKNSKHKAEVMKILDLTSTNEAQTALIKDNFGTSFLKGADNSGLPKQYADSADAFKEGHVYVPWGNWGVLSGDGVITEIGKLLQDHLSGAKSIDDVLKNVDKKADELRNAIK